jgi:hypothetical protein
MVNSSEAALNIGLFLLSTLLLTGESRRMEIIDNFPHLNNYYRNASFVILSLLPLATP